MFVDTHCHLTIMSDKSSEQVDIIVKEAADAGVTQIVTVATTLQDSINAVDIAKKCDGVWATVGIHPCDCPEFWRGDFAQVENLVKNKKENKIVALGETGLDFYHKPFFKQRQIDAFKAHIECAIEHDLPVIVHIRESAQEVLKVLQDYKGRVKGVAHCFLQTKEIADILIDLGFYLGVGGCITYPKNEWLREMIQDIDLKHLLLETDAPFLPPQQCRGKKNHPKYVPLIAEAIANIKKITVHQVGAVTTQNFHDLIASLRKESH